MHLREILKAAGEKYTPSTARGWSAALSWGVRKGLVFYREKNGFYGLRVWRKVPKSKRR